MNIIAVDDEPLALDELANTIKKINPQASVYRFSKPSQALKFANELPCEIAFLDIQMAGMTGVEFAKRLKEITPQINIIFVTGYSDYAPEAFYIHASGYLMKPVTPEDIQRELNNLRYSISVKASKKIQIQTFGNFEVFCNGKPVQFLRSKSKEIFAFLVDKCGTGSTMAEIANALWEDGMMVKSRQTQLRVYISDLKKSLANIGSENIIIKQKNNLLLDKTKVDCDLYDFIEGYPGAINSYMGQYMHSYSWAEFTAGYLDNHIK